MLKRLCLYAAAALLTLTACSTDDVTDQSLTTQNTAIDVAPSTTSSSTPATLTQTTTTTKIDAQIEKARQNFHRLVPDELFDQFTSCDDNGVRDSMACSGPKVGQFQFFVSEVKAASTAQLLTGLNSSRVLEETDSRIVGWSILGSTAVITVVDKERGLVMQQMVSTDDIDPEERINELGLLNQNSHQGAEETLEPTETSATTHITTSTTA
ncbi:putative secreted protein [Corynebacterium kutscheri]|uniref:Secreted protein n=1 Tax=Corynebacterium kutscheri TaxID=35755 RepID=A0AB38VR83_9CORY|nr:hypothetical protein [Corynebacterium kutscheri]VEH06316.1 putative secreted protein [Corynebacterium kutscheri]VEH82228.1 putative secreted protein [Corynebacterium kutscheri]